ncbi:MAG TPA: hypothetical protein VJI46_03105 [Candidatus Nanoarchaeia archaeon]|nr:hypothetical protein [Candidatus Nanoarchaeia archaeon]
MKKPKGGEKVVKNMSKVGVWAFAVGLVLAAIIALVSAAAVPPWSVIVLALLGVVAGLLNISEKEVQTFLVAAVAFLLSFQSLSKVAEILPVGAAQVGAFFGLLGVFVAPAAAIVAVKALYNIAKD